MSWFQDLAGKAENILNKIDQNAATVLQSSHKPDDAPVVLEVADIASTALTANFKRSTSALSLSSLRSEASPKPKALSLRASPSLSDVRKTTTTNVIPAPVDDGGPSVSIDVMNDIDDAEPAAPAAETAPVASTSASTSRRSSVSSSVRTEREQTPAFTIGSGKSPAPAAVAVTATHNGDGGVQSELIALKIVLNEIKAERDDALNEVRSLQNDLYAMQNSSNVAHLEESCTVLQNSNAELRELNASLEKSTAKYIKTISELESKLSKTVQSEAEMRSKMEWVNKEAAQAVNELQQYRSRAQTTLQLKDKLIEQLKNPANATHGGVGVDATTNSASSSHSLELEHLQREKSELLKESRSLGEQLTHLREYVANCESSQQRAQQQFDETVHQLNEQLRSKENAWRDFEADCRSQARELSVVREEMARMQAEFGGKLHAKDTELAKLRHLASRPPVAVSANDFEGRVQSLTQSLVQKQTSLETVTADRNALRFQLEKIEQEYRQAMAAQQRQPRALAISVNDTDDAKARLPMFMQETPFDTRVSRRVKRVYSSLDAVGVQIGYFLRRYPLVRILAIFYVALLHLWVMVVLCTSTPN